MQYYKIAMVAGFSISVAQIFALYILRDNIITLFTETHSVKEEAIKIWPLFLLFNSTDTFRAISGAVLKGCG